MLSTRSKIWKLTIAACIYCWLAPIFGESGAAIYGQNTSAEHSDNPEQYDKKYAYHTRGKFYLHGEEVSVVQFNHYLHKCDSIAKLKYSPSNTIKYVSLSDFSTPPLISCDGKSLLLKVSNPENRSDLILYKIDLSVNQEKREVLISAEEANNKVFKENFELNLKKHKVYYPGVYTYYWLDPDHKRTKLAVTWRSESFTVTRDTAFDFKNYHSFAWMTLDPMGKKLPKAFKQEFRARGLVENGTNPDIIIQLKFEQKKVMELNIDKDSRTSVSAVSGGGGSSMGGRGGRGGSGGGQRSKSETTTTWYKDTTQLYERKVQLMVKDKNKFINIWTCTIPLEPTKSPGFSDEDISTSLIDKVMRIYPQTTVQFAINPKSLAGSKAMKMEQAIEANTNAETTSGLMPMEVVKEILFSTETTSGPMGYSRIIIWKDSAQLEEQWNLANGDKISKQFRILPSEWKNLIDAISAYKLSELSDLLAPTNLRNTKQANKSKIEIKTNLNNYFCGYFDAYNPNQRLKKLMANIQALLPKN